MRHKVEDVPQRTLTRGWIKDHNIAGCILTLEAQGSALLRGGHYNACVVQGWHHSEVTLPQAQGEVLRGLSDCNNGNDLICI